MTITTDEILETLKRVNKIKEESKASNFGFDFPWEIFIQTISLLSPKSFGTKIQNRIISKNSAIQVSPHDDRGDFLLKGEYYEVKASLITVTNKSANIASIKEWQNVDRYLIVVCKVLENSVETNLFCLSKSEFIHEMKLMNALPQNGTNESNDGNKNIAKRFTLPVLEHNENWKRWKTK